GRGRLPRDRPRDCQRSRRVTRPRRAAHANRGALRRASALPGLPRLDDLRDPMTVTAARSGIVVEVKHPLGQHKLSYLRDKNTPTAHFRKRPNEVVLWLTRNPTKNLPTA